MHQQISTGLMFHRDGYFELDFTGNYFFEVKKASQCSIAEIHNFYLKLRKGNKVSPINLHERIFSTKYLGFCYHRGNLVGISAIKKPAASYVEMVHKKAGVVHASAEPILEVGFSFTEESFRQKGISTRLKTMLLSKIADHRGTLFSTTATPSSQRFLLANGFIACGHPYQGLFDDHIIYFERR